MPATRPRLRTARLPALAAALLAALAACTAADDGSAGAERTAPAAPLAVRTEQRIDVRFIGQDTLSDSAHVVGVFPESDGDAVAFTFADPVRGISTGLALTRRGAPTPGLVWPDSVTAVWWSAPHALAFTTASGRGVQAVVDVRDASAVVAVDSALRAPAPPASTNPRDPTRARATAYIDSLRVQPGGQPQGSALRYEVATLRVAPDGRLGAFYTVAFDSAGRRANPAWYAIDVETGAVALVDEIVGPVGEMPESAGGWTADGRFVYAKRQTIWEAEVRRDTR